MKMIKKCIKCIKCVDNPNHDYCRICFSKKEAEDKKTTCESQFVKNLKTHKIHTVYIMFYSNKEKIGYTNDLNSRILEIKRKYPNNKLVYFREFSIETEARRFEAWLKNLSNRELNKFISSFQDKVRKVERV